LVIAAAKFAHYIVCVGSRCFPALGIGDSSKSADQAQRSTTRRIGRTHCFLNSDSSVIIKCIPRVVGVEIGLSVVKADIIILIEKFVIESFFACLFRKTILID